MVLLTGVCTCAWLLWRRCLCAQCIQYMQGTMSIRLKEPCSLHATTAILVFSLCQIVLEPLCKCRFDFSFLVRKDVKQVAVGAGVLSTLCTSMPC